MAGGLLNDEVLWGRDRAGGSVSVNPISGKVIVGPFLEQFTIELRTPLGRLEEPPLAPPS